MKHRTIHRLSETILSHEFWIAVAMFMVAIPLHYPNQLLPFVHVEDPGTVLGLERHAVERVFVLLPITYVGFLFGMRAGIVASAFALAIMLPRALIISPNRSDALVEVAAVILIGTVINFGFERIRREQERRRLLAEQLQLSEERYRQIFENAHDAISVHDLTGKIVMTNRACKKVTGYELEELIRMTTADLLSEEGLEGAMEVRRRLIDGELTESFEQEIIRKDGERARLWLTTSVITVNGGGKAVQIIARDITEQARLRENLQFYLEQITRAQEHERERIARELHDDTVQSLLLIAQRLDHLGSCRRLDAAGRTAEELKLRAEVLQTLANLRRLTQDLRPRILDDLGLVPALEWLADDLVDQCKVQASVDVKNSLPELSQEAQLLLFRIAQEALRNVGKHSAAKRASISLRPYDNRVEMTITDDGKGFVPPKDISDLAVMGKLGLLGMYERARLLGGSFHIRSEPGQGTTVAVELPAANALKACG